MPMQAFSQVDRSEHNTVQVARKRLTFNNPGTGTALTVCKLPPGAIVVGGGLMVITAFNGSGTDLVDIGNIIGTTTTAAAYASALVASAAGYIILDDLATSTTSYSDTLETTVTATYTDQNTNSTAGVADVVIFFVTKPVV